MTTPVPNTTFATLGRDNASLMGHPTLLFPAAQARIVRGLDPVIALRRGGDEHAVLAAKRALELRACEQGAESRLAAGGNKGEAIQRTGDRTAVDHLLPGIAEPARNLESRLVVAAEKSQAAPGATRRVISEGLDRDPAELGVDGIRHGRRAGKAQLGNARRDVGFFRIGLAAGAIEFDHRRRTGGAEIAE